MQCYQSVFADGVWSTPLPEQSGAQWVLAFGSRSLIKEPQLQTALHNAFPEAEIVGCTTSGEIQDIDIYDESLCLTAVTFEHSSIKVESANASDFDNSYELAKHLALKLDHNQLRHVFVLSDGHLVNGSDLVSGLNEHLPKDVVITGGLAGDADRFSETIVWRNRDAEPGMVVVVGFYGDKFQVGHGHLGGWKPFGPERVVTRSENNVLYDLDGRPALELYQDFLADSNQDFAASTLYFPLVLREEGCDHQVVRTILSIDDENKAMVFAGNLPQGAVCQMARANYENLVDGASSAADLALMSFADATPSLAVLISCVGRRLVLGQRCEEELEVVRETLADECSTTGFYSYGEISPLISLGRCGLHNQTMTITLFGEDD